MSSAWICNASPLIALAHIERLDLLDALPTPVCVPTTVLAEIEAGRAGDAARAQVRSQPCYVAPGLLRAVLKELGEGAPH